MKNIRKEIIADIMQLAAGRIRDYERLKQAGLISGNGTFFPSVHYPPITKYPPRDGEAVYAGYTDPPDGRFDVYVHIPFCARHCTYCHYPGRTGPAPEDIDRYLDMLAREIDIFLRARGTARIRARSVLIGGGTPTYLSPAQLEGFLESFRARVDTSSRSQFNVDVDPSSLLGPDGERRMAVMRAAGVDRLTIGVQSLDDGILKEMNRPHTADDAARSVERAKAKGFLVNTEYIFGYPGQTLDGWLDTLERAVALDAGEIQLYRLKIIPYGDYNGPIAGRYRTRREEFPSVEEILTMKQAALSLLAACGYTEDLRRVFTNRKGIYSHYAYNQCCKLYDQVGFGLTAFSSLRDRFALNTQDFDEYYALVGQGRLPVNRGLVRSADEQARWAVVLPLKHHGVDTAQFRAITGVSLDRAFGEKIRDLKQFGLVEESGTFLRLSPLGRFFADEVCQQFHSREYLPFPQTAYAPGILNPYR